MFSLLNPGIKQNPTPITFYFSCTSSLSKFLGRFVASELFIEMLHSNGLISFISTIGGIMLVAGCHCCKNIYTRQVENIMNRGLLYPFVACLELHNLTHTPPFPPS